ncbi:NUDIX domain-containing protein [Candidatus Pacebacteria bacterium]|nr:NUDIX domain-containing protein [Candidatus Paceibacterota bacterium]
MDKERMSHIPLINDQDEVIGKTTIKEAKASGQFRRIVRVFIFDEAGRMLLQLRSKHVHASPRRWDQAVGGHVDYGESYQQAAHREMKEEIGIETSLTEIAISIKAGDMFNGIFKATINSNTKFSLDQREVEEVAWCTVEEFENDEKRNPQNYTSGFPEIWKKFRDKLITS